VNKEHESLKSLRSKIDTWQKTNPDEKELPLEIQKLAKEIARWHGYFRLSQSLKIDASYLFSKVGMNRIPYKRRPKALQKKSDRNITVTAIATIAPQIKSKINSLRAQLKNGHVIEVVGSISELVEFAKKLGE